MKSHTYQISPKEILQLAALPALPVALCPLIIHLCLAAHLLPPPRPTLDVERTILVHQVETTRQTHDAQILFIGDSSCLMGVDTAEISRQLGRPTLNLGTLSFLDLAHFASLLQTYLTNNPNTVKTVVLLTHAEALRRQGPKPYYTELFQHLQQQTDHRYITRNFEHLVAILGLDLFQTRLLTRLQPAPLPGAYGRFYGFTSDLDRYMTKHNGSALDPARKKLKGNNNYTLDPAQQAGSQTFKNSLPSNVQLIIGISPSPESFVQPSYPVTRSQMLEQWSRWTQADATLSNLPPVLPDPLFATVTHLNETGRNTYTKLMTDELKKLLR